MLFKKSEQWNPRRGISQNHTIFLESIMGIVVLNEMLLLMEATETLPSPLILFGTNLLKLGALGSIKVVIYSDA